MWIAAGDIISELGATRARCIRDCSQIHVIREQVAVRAYLAQRRLHVSVRTLGIGPRTVWLGAAHPDP